MPAEAQPMDDAGHANVFHLPCEGCGLSGGRGSD